MSAPAAKALSPAPVRTTARGRARRQVHRRRDDVIADVELVERGRQLVEQVEAQRVERLGAIDRHERHAFRSATGKSTRMKRVAGRVSVNRCSSLRALQTTSIHARGRSGRGPGAWSSGPPWSSHRRHPGLPRALGRPRRWHRGRRRASRAAGRHGPAGRAPRHPRPARTRRDRPRRRASGPLWHALLGRRSGCDSRSAMTARLTRCHPPGPCTGSWRVASWRAHVGARRSMRSGSIATRPTERRGSRSGLMLTTTRVSIRAGTRAATWSAVIAPIEWPSTWPSRGRARRRGR